MVRLKDVAARAGVSVMTVSKVLRDASDVSKATKAKVRRLAEQMGYVPDSFAQSLRSGKSRLLGVVVPSVAHPVLSSVLLALEERAHELGYDIIVAQSLDLPHREEICIRRLLSRRVDGIFIYPVYRLAPDARIYDELHQSATPTVLLGHGAGFCRQFVAVETEDLGAGASLTKYLIELGHGRIGFLAGPPAAPWAQQRLDGYRRALREASLETDDRLVFAAGASIEDGEKAALQLLNESAQVSALIGVNDYVAVGAANILLNQGLKIPDDLSVAGFGDLQIGEYFKVPLTTVQEPKRRAGDAAIDCMMRLLRKQTAESKRLAIDLVIRSSTAAPQKNKWKSRS